MKKFKIIENAQLNFHPEQVMDENSMEQLKGGFCACDKKDFKIGICAGYQAKPGEPTTQPICICRKNEFINLGGSGSTEPPTETPGTGTTETP